MAQSIREVMSPSPTCFDVTASVRDAARAMADEEIGDVIVCEGDRVVGILTDRDVAVRAVAEGMDPSSTPIGDVCSRDLTTLSPDDSVNDAVRLMRERAIRRLPIVEDGRAVGVVSIGDLAIDLDAESALADISAAPPNQ